MSMLEHLDQLAPENDRLIMNEVSYDVLLEKMHEGIYPKHGSKWLRSIRDDSSPTIDTLHWTTIRDCKMSNKKK